MSYHRTDSGHIEIIDQWGHGKAPSHSWAYVPAVITIEDGDGHYTAWKYSGSRQDAAFKAACLEANDGGDSKLWVIDDSHISPLDRSEWPEGVEITDLDEDGEPETIDYHPKACPGGLLVA